ncbi:MAG: bifunctional phosphoglucose/phosphomannose isomerase [Patescibacteria group bacterium]
MLDDSNFINKTDKSDALGLASLNAEQLKYEYNLTILGSRSEVDNIVVSGMGGSALGALFIKSWLDLDIPFEIVRDYSLPSYVNERTLVIVSSFSGNTEETLSCLDRAEQNNAKVVCVAGGGQLEERASSAGHTFVKLPECPQPRFAAFYSFKAMVAILVAFGVVDGGKLTEITETSSFLSDEIKKITQDVPTAQNPAKQLAQEIIGKSPVIYAGSLMAGPAYKWKISFNENAKNVAWYGVYPEFNHNEFIGWSSHPKDKPYVVIDLRSSFDHEQVKKRFEISDRLLSGQRPKANVVEIVGSSRLQQLVWAVTFGDFVSLYVAILNEVDPSPVALVEQMKKEL